MSPRASALLTISTLAVVASGLAVATGQASIVVTHGVSMNPVYYQGDLVVVTRQSSYAEGEVVAYRRAGHDGLVLHRIVGAGPTGWVVQGDNNASIDPTEPVDADIVGRAALHIPQGGIWMKRLISPPALAAYAFFLLAGGAAAARTKRQRRKERRTVSSRHRIEQLSVFSGLPPGLRHVAATAAAIGLLGVVLGGLSWTRPTTATTAGTSLASVDSSLEFSYVATVPASAAYDGTTVTAPQPVFRKLTDTVDVTYDYSGRPGAVAVEARLSSASGWTSTLQLSPRTTLRSEQKGSVRLDLSALEKRAEAAAAVTGIPAGSLTITVIPRILMHGGGRFAPELPLTLDMLTMKPVSEDALTASTSTPAAGTSAGTAPAQLTALGRSVEVQSARTASLGALLLATLLGLALLALARMHGPVSEADRIRNRHKALLLPVLPIALPPGRPVVDVPSIDALATLAQRYGLMVLHWERGGVATYIVQEDGTSYRFRGWGSVSRDTSDAGTAEQDVLESAGPTRSSAG